MHWTGSSKMNDEKASIRQKTCQSGKGGVVLVVDAIRLNYSIKLPQKHIFLFKNERA